MGSTLFVYVQTKWLHEVLAELSSACLCQHLFSRSARSNCTHSLCMSEKNQNTGRKTEMSSRQTYVTAVLNVCMSRLGGGNGWVGRGIDAKTDRPT